MEEEKGEEKGLTIDNGGDDPEDDDERDNSVQLGPPLERKKSGQGEGEEEERRDETCRGYKRAFEVGNHGPVKGEDAHAETRVCSEQGVDDNIVGGNPASPIEDAEGSEKEAWNPVPDEAANESNEEETFAGNVASVGFAKGLMKGIEEGGVDEGTGPNHAGGPDDVVTEEAAEGKANQLGREGEENLVGEGDILAIKDALCEGGICGVGTKPDDLSHDGDADMLLDRKRARIEGPFVAEGIEGGGREEFFQRFAAGQ